MDDEERPRKVPKLDLDESKEQTEPLMTGAIGVEPNGSQSQSIPQENDVVPTEQTDKNADTLLPTNGADNSTEMAPTLSKRQMKKQLQRERWEADREKRKVKRKEKATARKERRRAAWEEAKAQGKNTPEELRRIFPVPNRRKKTTRLPLTLVLDCGFDELMMDKERVSLGSQLTRSYSMNNTAPYSSHFVISSFDKKLKERFDTVLGKAHESWRGIRFMQEDFLHASREAAEWMKGPEGGQMVGPFADKTDAKPEDGEVVYLSSDSPDTLTELKPYSTYIIGGLVDKNRHKAVCYKRALELGIKTAKLPIGEYIEMASRPVLATNHVVEIMVRWLELQDWGEAFLKTIPPRKGAAAKGTRSDTGDSTPQADEVISEEEEEPIVVEAAEAEAGEGEDGYE